MSFSTRNAPLTTLILAVVLLTGVGAPGFAKELSESVNVPTLLPVPALADATAPVSAPTVSNRTDAATTDLVGTRPDDAVAFE